ncbi:hypothetical protein [Lysinibacillus odysseyi]|uniref:Uncharacterized protein n=1 Tax=Lysinibacillus odysseyi 34hs-1 = NBRC 100172 TaxID=1220589 RepID=A0A0A3II56_9BACI|nr:hypothetical protein [Lysinibacillus odysseyi]KGR84379.1 hypothetical protein CD32_12360 [Lysinibacillus odysseyi 34hs-1 = NBRC 100172]
MRKQTILWGLLVTGCLLGIYAQSLAYFLEGIFNTGWPIAYLTFVTVSSYVLLIFVAGISLWKKLGPLLTATLSVGGMVSMWSFFVLAMWWG